MYELIKTHFISAFKKTSEILMDSNVDTFVSVPDLLEIQHFLIDDLVEYVNQFDDIILEHPFYYKSAYACVKSILKRNYFKINEDKINVAESNGEGIRLIIRLPNEAFCWNILLELYKSYIDKLKEPINIPLDENMFNDIGMKFIVILRRFRKFPEQISLAFVSQAFDSLKIQHLSNVN